MKKETRIIRIQAAFFALLILCMSFAGCEDANSGISRDLPQSSNTTEAVPLDTSIPSPKKNTAETTAQSADEEASRKKAEEESRQQAAEESRRIAEEESRQQAAEESRLLEEEARKKAQEEARLKAEEEARKKAEEEARIKAEEEARRLAEEEKERAEQLNSFAMMYYLAITAEEIRSSKDNKLLLDDIYTSLLNDINPGSVDKITQEQLKNLREVIKSFMTISTKKERLNYIYNKEKANAIRSAVPNPLSILSVTNALDWKQLALSVAFTALDSVNNYKKANEKADENYLMSGWELEDKQLETLQRNRDRAFDYMVDMVREYNLDGMQTLNEKAVEKFTEICAIESVQEKIFRLTAENEKETYRLLGSYWLKLADCYFETSQYSKCMDCVEQYQSLYTGIFRKDANYARLLPKAIVAAQNLYSGDKYISVISGFADEIINNTETEDWGDRYFAAEVYLDLYSKTNNRTYIENAYKIALDNVSVLLNGQRKLNKAYLNPVVEMVANEPDYNTMSESEKKTAQAEFKEEKKRIESYNKELKNARETELPSMYEPLVLNCELLFALAKQINISATEKENINQLLESSSCGIFMALPVNDAYSFTGNSPNKYQIEITKDEIVIPANLLTADSSILVAIYDDKGNVLCDDCVVSEVKREGTTVDSFKAYVTSKKFSKFKWTAKSQVTVTIRYKDAGDKVLILNYSVVSFEPHWYGDKVVFG